jgi:hypothetical protein
MSIETIIGLLFFAGVIGLVLITANKKIKPAVKPIVGPVVNIQDPAIAAPQILFLMGLSPIWAANLQEASREEFQTTFVTYGCGTMECGIRDNGTGPYETMISATVRETGAMQPFYRTDTDAWCNDQWIPSGQFYWYPGDVRRWTQKVTGGCHPVYVEYPAGPKPALPADGSQFHVDFLIRARNRFGTESTPLLMSPRVQQHGCGIQAEEPAPVSGSRPCPTVTSS